MKKEIKDKQQREKQKSKLEKEKQKDVKNEYPIGEQQQ